MTTVYAVLAPFLTRARRSSICLLLTWAGLTQAAPPEVPLPAPMYSFDMASPSVVESSVPADAILEFENLLPTTMAFGSALGLGHAGDDLDALSAGNAVLAPDDRFTLLFSVDGDTIGITPPDPEMVDEGVPYNMTDQALRGHQAGDQFMSLAMFTQSGIDSAQAFNNVLLRNNYDEGGTDFGALPATSAADVVAATSQDRVDATAMLAFGEAYFSANGDSPSLVSMPCLEEPSGAHILFCVLGEPQPSLYASYAELGLEREDDIDALIVWDIDADGIFDGSDLVLFSLTPGSPSLATLIGASAIGAGADIFAVTPGVLPSVFAPAAVLGLGDPQDNVDALDLLLCDHPEHCAEAHGIRDSSVEEDDEEDEEDDDDHGPTAWGWPTPESDEEPAPIQFPEAGSGMRNG